MKIAVLSDALCEALTTRGDGVILTLPGVAHLRVAVRAGITGVMPTGRRIDAPSVRGHILFTHPLMLERLNPGATHVVPAIEDHTRWLEEAGLGLEEVTDLLATASQTLVNSGKLNLPRLGSLTVGPGPDGLKLSLKIRSVARQRINGR